ncbi:MAG: threonine synthase [Candidatus Bathyarchaeota archaeon]|nr:threonine synthase [Candidatus Bathyarchaeota archaeon]
MFVTKLKCGCCGREYPQSIVYKCKKCGGILDVHYDYDRLVERMDALFARSEQGVWKYRELLPIVDYEKIVSLKEGGTPLLKCDRLGKEWGLKNLYVKDETRNPTGSFKDRPTTVSVTKAVEFGIKTLTVASSGNAGVSASAYGAKAGINRVVFVPEKTPPAKLSQIIAYGAKVVAVEGAYSNSFKMARLASEERDWFNVTSTYNNPYATEGDKTVAYETYEQLNASCPDWVFIPIGSGPLLAGTYKGFDDLHKLSRISNLPRMVGVQSEGCAAIVRAFESGEACVEAWGEPETFASGIADPLQGYPEDGTFTLSTIRKSNGCAVACSDREILEAILQLARSEAIFAEPAGAAPIAGLKKLIDEGKIDRNDVVVCAITGHGLKEPDAVLERSVKPPVIRPTVKDLDAVLKRLFASSNSG